MKNVGKYYKRLPLLILVFLLGSCDKFLDEIPDNRVILDDLDKSSQLLTNAYSQASWSFVEWMTDNTGFIFGVTIRPNHEQGYEWMDFTDPPTAPDNPGNYWFNTYDAIAHANEVLAVLDELPAVTEEEKAQKRAVESEALLTRAYGHFMLVNLFGRHYDNRASTSPGIPYVDEPETVFIKEYKRITVQAVYDRVEEDMLRGIELIDDSFFSGSGKYHFNKNAALAFASRFYLFKGDYEKCLEYCDELLGNDPSPLIRDMTSAKYLNAGSDYAQVYTSTKENANLLLMRKISLYHAPSFGHGPTRTSFGELFDLNPFAGTTDERENPAYVKGVNGLFPVRFPLLFERSGINSNVGFNYHIFIAFSGEEVLLNRMECLVEMNRIDDAIADLQVLVDNRYSGSDVNVSIQGLRIAFGLENSPFVTDQEILDIYTQIERQKEFIGIGLRWFDIRRFEIEVDHELGDGSVITLDDNDRRKVLQIPQSAQDVGGLDPNPR